MKISTAKFLGPIAFKLGEQFRLDTFYYSLERRFGTRLDLKRIDTGEIRQVSLTEFYPLWSARRIVKVANSPFDPDYADYAELDRERFRSLSPSDLELAERRLPFVLAIDRMLRKGWHRNDENLQKLSGVVAVVTRWPGGRKRAPSCSSLRRWYDPWVASGRLLAALVPKSADRGYHRDDYAGDRRRIVDQLIKTEYLRFGGKTGIDICRDANAKIFRLNEHRDPSLESIPEVSLSGVYRTIKRLDPYAVTLIRQGEVAARFKHGVCGIREKADHLNAIWEIDHSPTDFLVLEDETGLPLGIPNLTLARDDNTKMPMGFAITFSSPSCLSVGKCLVNAISPKSYLKEQFPKITHDWPACGIPSVLKTDNGWEFHSKRLESAAYELGMQIKYMRKRAGWLKGMIERSFRTIHQKLTHVIPGTTLANFLARDGRDPTRYAIITWSEFLLIFHKFVVDVWIRECHRTTNRTPYDLWAEGHPEEYVRLPADLDTLRFSFAKRIEGAALRHDGVQHQYLSYRSAALGAARSRYPDERKVTLLVDEDDLGTLGVEFADGLRVLANCKDENYARGLTMAVHKAIIAHLRAQDRDARRKEERNRARAELLEMIEAALGKGRKWGNKRAARLKGDYSSWRVTNATVSPIFDPAAAPSALPAPPRKPTPILIAPESMPASYGHDSDDWGVEERSR